MLFAGPHVPFACVPIAAEQTSHAFVHAPLQQKPSTQKPVTQSPFVAQLCPCARSMYFSAPVVDPTAVVPPATSTCPLGKSVAVCALRPVAIDVVFDHVPAVGL